MPERAPELTAETTLIAAGRSACLRERDLTVARGRWPHAAEERPWSGGFCVRLASFSAGLGPGSHSAWAQEGAHNGTERAQERSRQRVSRLQNGDSCSAFAAQLQEEGLGLGGLRPGVIWGVPGTSFLLGSSFYGHEEATS